MAASKTEASDETPGVVTEEKNDAVAKAPEQHSPSESSNERDVRKQLRKTHVEATDTSAEKDEESSQESTDPRASFESATGTGEERQPRRKRSLDETDLASTEESTTKHVRKRSKSADKPATKNEGQRNNVRESRSATHMLAEASNEPQSHGTKATATATPDEKRPVTPPAKSGSTAGGFANASVTSPFAGLGSSKSIFNSKKPDAKASEDQSKDTSSNPTSFASLSASAKSPFGSMGSASVFSNGISTSKTESGGFGGFGKSTSFGSGSAFGSVSPFAGSGSKLGNFSSGKGSFGSSAENAKSSSILGSKETKVDDDADDNEAEGEEANDNQEQETSSELAKEALLTNPVDLETGEEDEETLFQSKCKLYISDGQWKERCTGTLKINRRVTESEKDTSARFIMRSDALHKVQFNSRITKDVKLEDPAKGPPKGRSVVFMGFMDGRPRLMLIRMKTNEQITELVDAVTALQESM